MTLTPDPLTLEHVRTLVERGGLTMEDHFAVKDEAWNIARLALKVAAELDKSQERVRLLEYDNEGHALYMGELYTTMQAEMPEHRSTVLLGRLLERWGCTSGERQYVPAVEHADALADARQEVERVTAERDQYKAHWQDMCRTHDAALRRVGALEETVREHHRGDSYGLILTSVLAQVARNVGDLNDEQQAGMLGIVQEGIRRRDALRAALEPGA